MHSGEFAAAAALIDEADAITQATGTAPLGTPRSMLAAWRGQEAQALELIDASIQDATARGEGRALGLAEYATAVLHNGLGHYEAALAAAQRACEHEDLGLFGWALVELVEAGARSGRPGPPPRRWSACGADHAPAAPSGRSGSRPAHARC